MGVLSKAFGLPGLRIGWIACRDNDLMNEVLKFKYYLTICNSAPSEILGLIALCNKNYILNRNNKIREDNLKLLDSFFKKHSNIFSWVRPQGGCTGFVKYKGAEKVEDFCKELVQKKEYYFYQVQFMTIIKITLELVLVAKICHRC